MYVHSDSNLILKANVLPMCRLTIKIAVPNRRDQQKKKEKMLGREGND